MLWNVYEAQYEGGRRFGGARLPDKVIAIGVHQGRADDLIRKAPGQRCASPQPKEA